jgi:uncharacterized protein (DUF1697 family)
MRGVNVGGHATINMGTLKKVLAENNYPGAATYINSGNVIVDTQEDKATMYRNIVGIVEAHFGFKVEMIIKTYEELLSILNYDPFDPVKEADNTFKVAVMLSREISQEDVLEMKERNKLEENFYVNGDVLYIYYHQGAGRSKFNNSLIEKKLGIISTARNWNTMLKMADMLR